MEFALASVTIVALLMTLMMGVVTWRLVREERRRSAARLAALAAEIRRGDEPAATPRQPPHPYPSVDVQSAVDQPRAKRPKPPIPTEPEPARPLAPRPPPVDVTIRPEAPSSDSVVAGLSAGIATGGLFGAPVESTTGPAARFAALGAAALLVVAVVSAAIVAFPDGDGDEAGVVAAGGQPLELLLLQHDKQGSFLSISGSVRNPVGAVAAHQLAVLAMAFDGDGAMVASGRAPVELRPLPPGVESRFAIQVPAAGVSRYRISFVVDDATVPHIDRRGAPIGAAAHGATVPPVRGVS